MLPTEFIEPGSHLSGSASTEKETTRAGHSANLAADATADVDSRDAHLRSHILDNLARRGIRPSKDLEVEVRQGTVYFRGRVQSYYQLQLIIHSVRLLPGDHVVHESIEVVAPPSARKLVSADHKIRPKWIRVGRAVALLTITLLLASCSRGPKSEPVYPVEGQVVFNGDPTPGAYVVFHPIGKDTAKSPRPSGHVGPDGSFHISTYSGSGRSA